MHYIYAEVEIETNKNAVSCELSLNYDTTRR